MRFGSIQTVYIARTLVLVTVQVVPRREQALPGSRRTRESRVMPKYPISPELASVSLRDATASLCFFATTLLLGLH